jgi:hypothetical protein
VGRNTWQNLINSDPRGLDQDGLTLASFTTSAPVFPPFIIPRNTLEPKRIFNVKARGLWSATLTPTYTFRLQNTVGTTVTLVTSAAITVSALTNQAWEIDLDVEVRTDGTAGTLEAMGDLSMGGVTGPIWLPATGTAPAPATVDTTIDQTWGLEVACSASSASNVVKGLLLKVRSEN